MFWIAFGDVHEKTDFAGKIPDIDKAAGLIVTGDLTNRGGSAAVRRVYQALAEANPNIMAQLGNMDTGAVTTFLDTMGSNIHRSARELTPGLGLMGVGFSTPTPFGTPSETSDETIGQWLDETHELAGDFARLILVCHTPPAMTSTDRLGTGAHVGSPAVRAFIERVQPEICLTGHIHESVAEDRIGRTRIFNPGMLASGNYVRIDYEHGELSASLQSV